MIFAWLEKIIEKLYKHLFHWHRRGRKCHNCRSYLALFHYQIVRDHHTELRFCNHSCACAWLHMDTESLNNYYRTREKSSEWF